MRAWMNRTCTIWRTRFSIGRNARNDEAARWYHAKEQTVSGPHNWNRMREELKRHPTTFVTVEGANIWLPLELVLLAAELLV